MAYFERLGPGSFRATRHTSGAWNTEEQHIAPALGLLAFAIEQDRDARRPSGLAITRLSYDILGPLPIGVVEVGVTVLRPGRTVELVEATLSYAGRPAVRVRAWLMSGRDTTRIAAREAASMPGPEAFDRLKTTDLWPGDFVKGVEVRRELARPGRGRFWVRTPVPLIDGEPVSDLARLAGLLDIANGMVVRVDPREVHFPNVDLTAHFFTGPAGEWLGFDTSVSFGPDGIGLTSSSLHDLGGPIGTLAQILTVRPRP